MRREKCQPQMQKQGIAKPRNKRLLCILFANKYFPTLEYDKEMVETKPKPNTKNVQMQVICEMHRTYIGYP